MDFAKRMTVFRNLPVHFYDCWRQKNTERTECHPTKEGCPCESSAFCLLDSYIVWFFASVHLKWGAASAIQVLAKIPRVGKGWSQMWGAVRGACGSCWSPLWVQAASFCCLKIFLGLVLCSQAIRKSSWSIKGFGLAFVIVSSLGL